MIPIRNIWLLMLYAEEFKPELEKANKGYDEDRDDIPNMIAEFLAKIVEKRLQRNLSYGYQTESKALNRVRGRIDFLKTERDQLLSKGKVFCHFEQFTIDTPSNQLVLAALDKVASLIIDNSELRNKCKTLAMRLSRLGVSYKPVSKAHISAIQISRNDIDDKAMITASKLVFNLKLPNQDDNGNFIYSPVRDERWLWGLFEKAVRGFYKHMLRDDWKLNTKRNLQWPVEEYHDSGAQEILPKMEVDMILDNVNESKRIVIDTKFNDILKENQWNKQKLKSNYLYQIYTYLMTQKQSDDKLDADAMGVMLHPEIGSSIDKTMTIQGHPLRFVTVDLSATTMQIKEQLLNITNIERYYH